MMVKSAIFVGAAALCLAVAEPAEDGGFKFSINSPRNRTDLGRKSGILVPLPENIQREMSWQDGKRHQDRLHEAILGFAIDTSSSTTTRRTTSTTSSSSTAASTSGDDDDGIRIVHPQQSGDKGAKVTTTTEKTLKNDVFQSKSRSTEWWSIAWEAHVYFSGTLFALLAIYCSVSLARLHTFSRLFSRGYFVALNLSLILIGVIRPVWLFHDPYNAGLTWHRVAVYLLVDTGFPCMTTAFAILFLALLRATRIELISPSFQTPEALAAFCLAHFLVSFGIDVTIGMAFDLRYMVLILQGIFIVWSLLLSAGFFYIFSAMKKIAARQQGDFIRSMYPKLILEGDGSDLRPPKKPPLVRAVHLSLGVAVLGSLLGGVQLFAMIKMFGLAKEDLNGNQNEWAWSCYQVSMRILEAALCTLLAVIATTPLRYDFEPAGDSLHPLQSGSFHHVRVGGVGGATELDYESNSSGCGCRCGTNSKHGCDGHQGIGGRNQTLRNSRRTPQKANSSWLCCLGFPRPNGICCGESNPPREFEDEIYSEICSNNQSVRQVLQDPNNFYSTLIRPTAATGSGSGIPLGPMTNNELTNAAATGLNGVHHPAMVVGTSNTLMMPYNHKRNAFAGLGSHQQSATLLRSNFHDVMPQSAMIQNGHDASNNVHLLSGSSHQPLGGSGSSSRATIDTALYSNLKPGGSANRPSSMLFNDSGFVRFKMGEGEPTVQQESHPLNLSTDDLASSKRSRLRDGDGIRESQSFDESVLFVEKEEGDESKESLKDSGDKRCKDPPEKNNQGAAASGKEAATTTPSESDETAYGRTSSIYSRAPSQCSSVSATQSFDMRMYGRSKMLSATTSRKGGGELETGEKLQNPYYYYGSTRNQKTQGKKGLNSSEQVLKPKPLLPSQRQALEMQARGIGERPKSRQEVQKPPPSRQALLASHFQRSRSLGGYYAQPVPAVEQPSNIHPGSLTPMSYAKWQHDVKEGNQKSRRKHNPLYDTPPVARRPPPHPHHQEQAIFLRYQLEQQQHQQMLMQMRGEIRGVMGTPPAPSRQPQPPVPRLHLMNHYNPSSRIADPLSPILTDQEMSPSQRRQGGKPEHVIADFLTSDDNLSPSSTCSSSSRGDDDFKRREAKADVSKVDSSIFNGSGLVSPLEYSAMLKLYSQDPENGLNGPKRRKGGGQDGELVRAEKDGQPQHDVWLKKTDVQSGKKGYALVSTNDGAGSTIGQPETLFSSSDSEGEVRALRHVEPGKKSQDSPPGFRWDGSRLDPKEGRLPRPREPASDDISETDEAPEESESVFTEDGMEDVEDNYFDDDSALADIETDYDDESRAGAVNPRPFGGAGGALMAKKNMEQMQKSLDQKKVADSQQQNSPSHPAK